MYIRKDLCLSTSDDASEWADNRHNKGVVAHGLLSEEKGMSPVKNYQPFHSEDKPIPSLQHHGHIRYHGGSIADYIQILHPDSIIFCILSLSTSIRN